MLEVVKNMTLNGVSKIDGQPVAYMNATLSTDGNGSNNINTNIVNRELYNKFVKILRILMKWSMHKKMN